MKLKLLLLFAALCAACGDSGDSPLPDTPPYTKPDGSAAVLTEKVTRYFTSVDDGTLTLAAATPAAYVPQEGDIICCGITPNTPDGFLGRVTHIAQNGEGYTITTETIALDEAFESLSADERIDPSAHVESVTDEEGNSYRFETVDSSVWEQLNAPADTDDTRAYTAAYGEATLRIPLDGVSFGGVSLSGSLYVDSRLDIGLGIHRHRVDEAHVQLSIRTGSETTLSAKLQGGFEHEIKSLDIKLGRIPIAGGAVVLRPILKLSLSIGADGKITAETTLRNQYMNSVYRIDYANGQWSEKSTENARGKSGQSRATKLEMNGELYTQAKAGMLVGVYSHKIVGIGFNAVGRHTLQGEFSLEDDALFRTNTTVGIDRTLSGEFYFYARLFGKDLGRHEIETGKLDLGSVLVALLPETDLPAIEIEKDRATISAQWERDEYLLEVSCGYTLFDDAGRIVDTKAIGPASRQTDAPTRRSTNESVEFSLGDPAAAYYVAPHVTTLDGRYFYGEKVPLATIVGKWRNQTHDKTFIFYANGTGVLTDAAGTITDDHRIKYTFDPQTGSLRYAYTHPFEGWYSSTIAELTWGQFRWRSSGDSWLFKRVE